MKSSLCFLLLLIASYSHAITVRTETGGGGHSGPIHQTPVPPPQSGGPDPQWVRHAQQQRSEYLKKVEEARQKIVSNEIVAQYKNAQADINSTIESMHTNAMSEITAQITQPILYPPVSINMVSETEKVNRLVSAANEFMSAIRAFSRPVVNVATSTAAATCVISAAQCAQGITAAVTTGGMTVPISTATSACNTAAITCPAAASLAMNAIANQSEDITHNPINPGPLHEMKATEIPISEGGPSIADTFRSGTYTVKRTQQSQRFYRVQPEPYQTGIPLRRFWTSERPNGPTQSIVNSALRSEWGNDGTRWIEIEVPTGNTYYQGTAGPQGRMTGGGDQVFFENVPSEWFSQQGSF